MQIKNVRYQSRVHPIRLQFCIQELNCLICCHHGQSYQWPEHDCARSQSVYKTPYTFICHLQSCSRLSVLQAEQEATEMCASEANKVLSSFPSISRKLEDCLTEAVVASADCFSLVEGEVPEFSYHWELDADKVKGALKDIAPQCIFADGEATAGCWNSLVFLSNF